MKKLLIGLLMLTGAITASALTVDSTVSDQGLCARRTPRPEAGIRPSRLSRRAQSRLRAFDSADYYVSTTGNDSNNGTSRSTAFRTIAHAVEIAGAGQKICVLKGTYEVVAPGTQYAAIACFSSNGLITHCVISNNFSSMGRTSPNQKTQSGGTEVFLKAGTLRESLVAYN
jgi:hypothetical protein